MDKRSMRELVERFNGTIATMDIEKEYKSQLVGMVIAMGEKYDNDVTQQKYILRVNSIVRKEELRKMSEELKKQSDNIIVVPYDVDVVYPVIQGWIPVTERLPENNEEVLTTYIVNGNKNKRYTETATYYDDDDGGKWSSPWDEYRVPGTRIEVIAWMLIPDPWKGEQNENDRR